MPSARSRRKALEAARPKLHPTSNPLAYGLGVAGPPPARSLALVIGAAVALTVVLSVLMGAVAGPGWLFFFTFWAFNPTRAVVTTSNSVVVMGRSPLNGRPTDVRVVARVDAVLAEPTATSGPWRAYRIGEETVWLTRKEAALVVDAARGVVAGAGLPA